MDGTAAISTDLQVSGGEAILLSLKSNGVDRLFINSGSDLAPIIEAYAKRGGKDIPEVITAAHENVVVSMAHGHFLATGRMAAAMVHVNVGLANAAMGLLNARSDDVPIFMISGRNPLTEGDRLGSRSTPIQYGQEMFDQTGIVREAVKWDYELRYAENASDLVSRGCAIALTEPQGSVYLSLPREPLCELTKEPEGASQVAPSVPYPDPAAIKEAARSLARARNPLIICSRGDAAGQVGAELQAIARENSIAVSEVFVTRNVLPTEFEFGVGGNVASHLPKADAVLVVDAAVAWIESKASTAPGAEIMHLGPDPLFGRMPVRGYRTTQAILCNTVAGLKGAADGASRASPMPSGPRPSPNVMRRSGQPSRQSPTVAAAALRTRRGSPSAFRTSWGDGVVFGERGGPFPLYNVSGPNQWFGNTQAGGLGWGLAGGAWPPTCRPG